ncbi:MAG TPA: hypothetical protein VGI39_23925 [Polyangiaceae bacterium]|jgi:hypothetical protein
MAVKKKAKKKTSKSTQAARKPARPAKKLQAKSKGAAKKTAAKKGVAKKSLAKKGVAKKSAAKKSVASAAKKSAAKKLAAKAPKKAAKPRAAAKKAPRAKALPAKAEHLKPRRDGAGHLDPAYAATLRELSEEGQVHDDNRAFVGERSAGKDDLAEEMGESFVATATSGEEEAEEAFNQEVPEEGGGPFVATTGGQEFAEGTDESNPEGTKPEPFPTT